MSKMLTAQYALILSLGVGLLLAAILSALNAFRNACCERSNALYAGKISENIPSERVSLLIEQLSQ